jgi:hypothetical protein
VLAGAGGPTAIAAWAATKQRLLTGVLDLPHRIPGKDVFRHVLMTLQPTAFQACFVNWLKVLRGASAAATGVDRPVLAVVGKTARRSHDRPADVHDAHTGRRGHRYSENPRPIGALPSIIVIRTASITLTALIGQ